MIGCFSVLWQGRRLGADAVSRTQVRQICILCETQTALSYKTQTALSYDLCEGGHKSGQL